MKEVDRLELENVFYQNRVNELENTLSDTIAFFSASLTLTGLGVALLTIVLGYILNQVFSDKLTKVQNKSDEVESLYKQIEKDKLKIETQYEKIVTIEKKIDEFEKNNTTRDEIIDYYARIVDFLYEKSEFNRLVFWSEKFLSDLERKLEKDDFDEYTKDLTEFKYSIIKDFGDYLHELEQNEKGEILKELEDFNKELKKLKRDLK